jgi:hypothetical protein
MNGSDFDQLARHLNRRSRRTIVRALIFASVAVPLFPARTSRAELSGAVVLGGACAASVECRQQDMQAQAICAGNGFALDGTLSCCVDSGCCSTDADCCGDLRCAPTGDVCSSCALPPFPTRSIGQLCTSDNDCVHSVGCSVSCHEDQCICRDAPRAVNRGELPLIPDIDLALIATEMTSRLEVTGQSVELYESLHPDAQSIIPSDVIAGWYANDFPYLGEPPAEAMKVRFVAWTWEVNGKTYPETAEVATRQQLSDGRVLRDAVRLVKDANGDWSWFFGRDRAFVAEQIARYATIE